MNFNAAMVFVKVVQLGSFTKASQDLKLPKSTVSDKISDLERDMGVKLLLRTTRKLRLTDAGSAFFTKAEIALASLESAAEDASSFQKKPSGNLKITGPAELEFSSICDVLLEYRAKFPDVKLELLLTNRVVDLVKEGVDIAIRAAPDKGSRFVSKRLGASGLILVASPKYLQRSPTIRSPRDLQSHKCLIIKPENGDNSQTVWNLVSQAGKKASIKPEGYLSTNAVGAIQHLALIGEGIALLPPTLTHQDISKGRLIHVLPDWATAAHPVYLVHADHRSSSPKVKEMIPMLEPCLRNLIK